MPLPNSLRAPLRFAPALVLVAALLAAGGLTDAAEPPVRVIDAAVREQFPAHPHSGFSVSIVHGGHVVYAKANGYRDDGTPDRFIAKDQNYYGTHVARPNARRAPADPDTIYAIGSVTKQFTAAAVLLLVEAHRLSLDDEVSRYAPEFAGSKLTLRMLLNQRSGLPDLNTLTFLVRVRPLATRPDGTLDELRVCREIAALPTHFAPGARFEYSNSNYFVLGSIVQRVTGEALATVLATRIFKPLQMTRTAYGVMPTGADVALGYRVDQSAAVWRAYPWDLAWLGGAGAMTSTANDLARWNIALLGHRVLQPGSLAQMWHGIDAGSGQGSYAMGWIEDALGSHRYLWHNGEVGGFHAVNVIFPNDDLALAIVANNQDAKPEYLVPRIAAVYFPVSGLDSILPRSGVVLIEASAAVALGALAIAIVAIFTFKRFIVAGVSAGVLALVAGFCLPVIVGFVLAGLLALIPTALYMLAVRFIPRPVAPSKKLRGRS